MYTIITQLMEIKKRKIRKGRENRMKYEKRKIIYLIVREGKAEEDKTERIFQVLSGEEIIERKTFYEIRDFHGYLIINLIKLDYSSKLEKFKEDRNHEFYKIYVN